MTNVDIASMAGWIYMAITISVYCVKWNAHRPSKTQYSMLDYCYSVNGLTVAWVVGVPIPEVKLPGKCM